MLNSPVRAAIRDAVLRVLSMGRRIDATTGWVRMPYYHHVFDNERKGFAEHLDYLRRFGEFISLDDAVALIASGVVIDGRYFCVGFDDGFKSCMTGAFPILAERAIPATFYVVTDMIGRALSPSDPVARDVFGFCGKDGIEFLSWDDCLTMIAGGMTIGSHTVSHVHLAECGTDQVARELAQSKMIIERETRRKCAHFCAPYGSAMSDRDTQIARTTGYLSSSTGLRGANRRGGDVFGLHRDHLMANWGIHQLRYFMSL